MKEESNHRSGIK